MKLALVVNLLGRDIQGKGVGVDPEHQGDVRLADIPGISPDEILAESRRRQAGGRDVAQERQRHLAVGADPGPDIQFRVIDEAEVEIVPFLQHLAIFGPGHEIPVFSGDGLLQFPGGQTEGGDLAGQIQGQLAVRTHRHLAEIQLRIIGKGDGQQVTPEDAVGLGLHRSGGRRRHLRIGHLPDPGAHSPGGAGHHQEQHQCSG